MDIDINTVLGSAIGAFVTSCCCAGVVCVYAYKRRQTEREIETQQFIQANKKQTAGIDAIDT
jgi:predicted acylesterase/phospholipase RssA